MIMIQGFNDKYHLKTKRLLGEAGAAKVEENKGKLDEIKALTAGYSLDHIFNADETGLFYRSLPNLSVTLAQETARGGKKEKERVTAVLCSNASGSCKISITIIGKAAEPYAFRNCGRLPVVYESQKKAWMDIPLFNRFIDNFKVEVRKKNPDQQILLLCDNAPAHARIDDNDGFKIVFFPPNVTSVHQPMDRGIIAAVKKRYRYKMLHALLDVASNPQSAPTKPSLGTAGIQQGKAPNLKEACDTLAQV